MWVPSPFACQHLGSRCHGQGRLEASGRGWGQLGASGRGWGRLGAPVPPSALADERPYPAPLSLSRAPRLGTTRSTHMAGEKGGGERACKLSVNPPSLHAAN